MKNAHATPLPRKSTHNPLASETQKLNVITPSSPSPSSQANCKRQQTPSVRLNSAAETTKQAISNTCKLERQDQNFWSFSASYGTAAFPRPKGSLCCQQEWRLRLHVVSKAVGGVLPFAAAPVTTTNSQCPSCKKHSRLIRLSCPWAPQWTCPHRANSHSTLVKFCAWYCRNRKITEEHTTMSLI